MQKFVLASGRFNSMVHAVTTLAATLILFGACKELAPSSRLKIDSGESINQSSSNKVEGVFFSFTHVPGASSGGACTGTAVSTSTAITAAHCVVEEGDRIDKDTGKVEGKEYCIDNAIYKKVCSKEIYANPLYLKLQDSEGGGTDFAWVVFPAGTFKYIFPMNTTPLQVGDEILLVGYSEAKLTDKSKGSKRFGWNKVASLLSSARSDVYSFYGNSFEKVAVSPGDSGGPIMKNCQVSGVASRMTEETNKQSIHTNLTHPQNAAFLKAAGAGAYFCGLSGNDASLCPTTNMYTPKANVTKASKEFPCVVASMPQDQQPNSDNSTNPDPQPAPQPAPQPTPQPQQKSFRIFAALNENNELLVKAEEMLSSAIICVGPNAESANACTSRTNAVWDGRAFKAKLNLSSSPGAVTFAKIQAVRQRDAAKSWQMLRFQRK